MRIYNIEGSHPLAGSIRVEGNKNAALPCIAACLLTENTVVLHNIPEIQDVLSLFEIIESLGATVKKIKAHSYSICAQHIYSQTPAKDYVVKIRASILLAGPLLARFGHAVLHPPGGDVIGRRRLDTHILGLQALGAHVSLTDHLEFKTNQLTGDRIFLDEASVTATENIIMAAVLAKGPTILENAACEPHVQDLCHLLVKMGAKIEGIGSNLLHIEGVSQLGGAEFTISPDFMEIGSFIGLAAATKSQITIENVIPSHLRMIEHVFHKLGVYWQYEPFNEALGLFKIITSDHGQLKMNNDFGQQIPKIEDATWPGFPADLMSIMIVLATQAQGTVLIHDKLYESRMFFVDKLISMGARIILCDPHRAVISGPTQLHGGNLSSPDIRAGMALLIAALAATGKSTISNIYQIERGYEDIVKKLQKLGAKIQVSQD